MYIKLDDERSERLWGDDIARYSQPDDASSRAHRKAEYPLAKLPSEGQKDWISRRECTLPNLEEQWQLFGFLKTLPGDVFSKAGLI